MVDVRFLFKQMPRNRSLTRSWLVEIKTDRALMTCTPQHSLHATAPRSAVWRVACKLNPCTQALRMGDERFLSNVLKRFLKFLLRFYVFNVFNFFLNVFYIYGFINLRDFFASPSSTYYLQQYTRTVYVYLGRSRHASPMYYACILDLNTVQWSVWI